MASRSMPPQHYTIGGVKVAFPCKAYPTQLSMMSMIIKGIDREQNCLLESPTGSGKSLALLCSALAWQHNEYAKRGCEERENGEENGCQDECDSSKPNVVCVCNCATQGIPGPSLQASTSSDPTNGVCTVTSPDSVAAGTSGVQITSGAGKDVASTSKDETMMAKTSTEEEDDFQQPKKRFRTPIPMPKKIKHRGIVYEEDETGNATSISPNPHTQAHWKMQLKNTTNEDASNSCMCQCHQQKTKMYKSNSPNDEKGEGKAPKKIPKIFFGTRTHKQIAQIIRELKKTAYDDSRMCILGSREYTCVHPRNSKGPNKNEGCKELLDGKHGEKCSYFSGTHKIKQQWQLQDRGFTRAWDIEDLVQLGKKIRACPYYATRSLKDEADIIFCPYNYLVDPVIRDSMDIDMKGQIIVLDEAHNIEDSAREAASYSVTEEQLQETIDELERFITYKWRQPHTDRLRMVCNNVKTWITNHSGNLRQADYDRALKVFSGHDIDGMLRQAGIVPDTLHEFKHDLAVVTEENSQENEDDFLGLSMSAASGMMLKGLFIVIGFLFKQDKKYMRDYKIALVRAIDRRNRRRRNNNNENRWLSARNSNEPSMNTTLHFWCLNPAVAFSDFGSEVRSIILTSGTLSPMTSFASELGVNFPIQLEANHVIHKSQVWVGTVALGPNGTSLNASYRNAETFAFQDEIARLLLYVCQVIPYGVLCFLPSYSMLSKLMDRWQTTGAWEALRQKKEIMMETRGGDKTEFDEQLREYYQLIKDCEETDIETQEITGGLFFAVCRGKVSEGMDFADNNARAVITIGIPFPNFKDTQVELKRQYNDQHSASRGLLTGSEWYEIQAYRALNQALGRCIRHKMDWGALILVDERYHKNPQKYINGLSKWVRAKVNHHVYSRDAVSSLSEFAQARLLKPCPEISNTSMSSPPTTPSQVTVPSVNAAGFTPSQVTTPSVNNDTFMGYTPIPSTSSNSVVKPYDNTTTPNMMDRSGANARRGSGSPPNQVSTPVVTTPHSMHEPRQATQMVLVNGMFVKASSSLAIKHMATKAKAATKPPTPVMMQQGTTAVQPQGNVQCESGNVAVSLHTPAVQPQNTLTPQQQVGGDKSPVTGDSNIPTPKAKLNFVDEDSGKTKVQKRAAQRLQLFARKASSEQNTPQSNKGNTSRFYEFVSLTNDESEAVPPSKQNGCQNDKSVSMVTKSKLEIEGERMEFNQTPPPLFDSENTVIPESPERTNEDPSEVQDVTQHASERSGNELESRTRKRKLENVDAMHKEGSLHADATTRLDNKPVNSTLETNNNKQLINGSVKLESDAQNSAKDEMSSSRSRRRRLSRHKDEKTPVKMEADGQEFICKQEVKDDPDPLVNPDDCCNNDVTDGQVSVRRSARRRQGQDKGSRCRKTSNDFLDSIADSASDKVGKCLPACHPGLFCIHCGEDLSADLQGLETISTDELPSEFLKKQTKISKRSRYAVSCTCQAKRGKLSTSKLGCGQETWLVGKKELLRHCEPVVEGTRVQKGMTLNAHWSEADQCCYQPVCCSFCPKGFIQLGYLVLATNNGSMTAGQVWFPPQSVGLCQQATLSKKMDI